MTLDSSDTPDRSYSLANLFLFVTACALLALLSRGVLREIDARGANPTGSIGSVLRKSSGTSQYGSAVATVLIGSVIGLALGNAVGWRVWRRPRMVVLCGVLGLLVGAFIGLQGSAILAAWSSGRTTIPSPGDVDAEIMALFATLGAGVGLIVGVVAFWRTWRKAYLLPLGALAGLIAGLLAGTQLCAPANLVMVTMISVLLVVMALVIRQSSQGAARQSPSASDWHG